VASDPAAHFPRSCVQHLAKIPVIQIDPHPNATTHLCRLQIPGSVAGIDAEGTAYRMDGVPIRMKSIITTGVPNDTEILQKLYNRIQEVKGE